MYFRSIDIHIQNRDDPKRQGTNETFLILKKFPSKVPAVLLESFRFDYKYENYIS